MAYLKRKYWAPTTGGGAIKKPPIRRPRAIEKPPVVEDKGGAVKTN